MVLPSGASASASATSGTPSPDNTGGRMLTQSEAIAAGVYTEHQAGASDGSVTYQYNFADGMTAMSVTPPPGFRPLTATDTELMKYGFPVRPTSSAALASWTQAMAAWRATVTPRLSVQVSSTPHVVSGAYTTRHWGGYFDYTNSEAFTGAESTFAAPTVGSGCGTPGGIGIWTGLGGHVSPDLIQSGIEAGRELGGPTVWQPFWELLNSTHIWTPNLLQGSTGAISISPGNVMFSKTTYSPATTGSARFFIENETTGESTAYTIGAASSGLTGPIENYYNGSTADFITEDPGGQPFALPFSNFSMTKSEADENGTWGSLAADGPVEWSNTRVALGPIGSTEEAFSVGFNQC